MAFHDSLMLPLRGVQALFLIIVLGLSGYVTNKSDDYFNETISEFDYLLFASIWTILALAYLIVAPRFVPAIAHKFALLAVEGLTMIFWFTAWIACAAFLGNHYGYGNIWRSAQAGTVFGAFEWILFVATLVFQFLGSRGGSSSAKGPAPYGHA